MKLTQWLPALFAREKKIRSAGGNLGKIQKPRDMAIEE